MKPLTDDEEILSFLPPTPEVRVPSSRKKKDRIRNKRDIYLDDDQDSFCQTWMIKSVVKMLILFFTTIAGIHFGRSLSTFMPHIHITKWNGLQLDSIQNWCLDVSSNSCECANPLAPRSRHHHKLWDRAYKKQKETIASVANSYDGKLDVLFLGDSIIEGFKGTSYGIPQSSMQENLETFEGLFLKNGTEVRIISRMYFNIEILYILSLKFNSFVVSV